MAKAEKPKYPPIDKLKAAVLERKLVMHLNYQDLADVANVSAVYIRKMMTEKHSDDWNPHVREAICQYLGLNVKVVLEDMFDLSKEMACK